MMSLVNMVPRQANWESKLLMIAANTPIMRRPNSHGFSTNCPTIDPSTILVSTFPLSFTGKVNSSIAYNPAAQVPMITHGSHTTAMQIGCATMASRKVFADLAVSQC